jgi:hypothetical protein
MFSEILRRLNFQLNAEWLAGFRRWKQVVNLGYVHHMTRGVGKGFG